MLLEFWEGFPFIWRGSPSADRTERGRIGPGKRAFIGFGSFYRFWSVSRCVVLELIGLVKVYSVWVQFASMLIYFILSKDVILATSMSGLSRFRSDSSLLI